MFYISIYVYIINAIGTLKGAIKIVDNLYTGKYPAVTTDVYL